MSCYHPIPAFRTANGIEFSERSGADHFGRIDIPCGQCIGCRMRRASDWELRIMHEASLWPESCFVTLTYSPEFLPSDGSLSHRHVQLFMKRLRKHFGSRLVRFYAVGEYGSETARPHYHICLFNVDFRSDRVHMGKSGSGAVFDESAVLSALWKFGRCSVQDLTPETASYCARYIMTKALGNGASEARKVVLESGEIVERVPEYARMSLRPGIGARWLDRYARDVYPHDFVVARGKKRRAPRFYDTVASRSDAAMVDEVKAARALRARDYASENTEERLLVREVVHNARVSKLKRSYSE